MERRKTAKILLKYLYVATINQKWLYADHKLNLHGRISAWNFVTFTILVPSINFLFTIKCDNFTQFWDVFHTTIHTETSDAACVRLVSSSVNMGWWEIKIHIKIYVRGKKKEVLQKAFLKITFYTFQWFFINLTFIKIY